MRPPELARDTSTDIVFMQHALSWLQENEGYIPEYLVYMRPTTPLREPNIVE